MEECKTVKCIDYCDSKAVVLELNKLGMSNPTITSKKSNNFKVISLYEAFRGLVNQNKYYLQIRKITFFIHEMRSVKCTKNNK